MSFNGCRAYLGMYYGKNHYIGLITGYEYYAEKICCNKFNVLVQIMIRCYLMPAEIIELVLIRDYYN